MRFSESDLDVVGGAGLYYETAGVCGTNWGCS